MNAFILYVITLITSLQVSSPAFKENDMIPSKYTCEGFNVNPPLTIENIPAQTKSLAVIMDDPDAPGGNYDHWIIWNIDPADNITENANIGISGKNSKGNTGYTGPCPPTGTHHYHFKIYALDMLLTLKEGASKMELQTAMEGHILANGELVGVYQKEKQ